MPILGIWASSRPAVAADTGAMFPLQVITVGPSDAANVTFTNIPNTYSHLQIRLIARSTTAGTGADWVYCQFNSDTGSNYAHHRLIGDGATASAGAATSITEVRVGPAMRDGNTAGIYGVSVVDILDYANTNKNTTVRSLMGQDRNGAGEITLYSGLWLNTSAITSIKLYSESNNLKQYSQFALYGVRSA